MKKIFYVLLLVIGLLFTNVYAEDNGIILKNIEKVDISEYVEEFNPAKIENNELFLDIKMYSIGDYIKYKLTVENKSDKDLYLDKDTILM